MKHRDVFLAGFLALIFCMPLLAAPTGLRIGGCLWYNADWDLQTTWTDLMHTLRGWNWTTMTDQGTVYNPWPWPNTAPVTEVYNCPKDSDGYPLVVPYPYGGQQYRPVSPVLTQQSISNYPYGTYTFTCEGTGTVVFGWNHLDTVVAKGGVTTKQFQIKQGDITFTRAPDQAAGIMITIIQSSASDHIHGMHLYLPGYDQNSPLFTPQFINMCKPFNPIRAMDWTGANGGKQHFWSDRVRPTSIDQTDSEGVAYEFTLALANTVNSDIWITCPPTADSEYFAQLAKLVYTTLNPNLKCWIEWGNETWWEAAAGPVSRDSGAAHGLDQWSYNGYASARLFKAFQDVYGSAMASRVVKVEAGQAGNSGVGGKIFAVLNNPTYNPWGIKADAYAVTAYFNTNGSLQASVSGGPYSDSATAQQNNVLFCTYEGGSPVPNTPALYPLYGKVLKSLEGTFYNFNQYVIGGAYYGGTTSYGASTYLGEPLDSAYKAKALIDYATEHGWYVPTAVKQNSAAAAPISAAKHFTVTSGNGYVTFGGIGSQVIATVRIVNAGAGRSHGRTRSGSPG